MECQPLWDTGSKVYKKEGEPKRYMGNCKVCLESKIKGVVTGVRNKPVGNLCGADFRGEARNQNAVGW